MAELTVVIDGAVVPAAQAALPVTDRAVLHGDSVFETVRVYGGVPFGWGAHRERLLGGAVALGYRGAPTEERLDRDVEIAMGQGGAASAVLRVALTRGSGPLGLDPRHAGPVRRVVLMSPFTAPTVEAQARGLAVITFPGRRAGADGPLVGVKLAAYAPHAVALGLALDQGAGEALLRGPDGVVTGGASSNVLVRLGAVVIAPGPESGALPGVTRARALVHLRAAGRRLEERGVSRDELDRADEVLITSSLREVAAVVAIDGRPVANGRPGELARQLAAALAAEVLRETGVGTPAWW